MNRNLATIMVVHVLLLVFALINRVYAAEESLPSKFLGSPLLVLTAIIIIDIIAYLYRKIRK
ncbi:MAG: hypothetical protein QXU45_08135 [Candidatus Bathyarchaeia archaeon]